jgi:hypothetical protein
LNSSDWKKWLKRANENGISRQVFRDRVIRSGWSLREAAERPKRPFKVISEEIVELAEQNGINYKCLYARIHDNLWDPHDAATIPIMSKEDALKLAAEEGKAYRKTVNKRILNDKNNLFHITTDHKKIAEQNEISKNTMKSRVYRSGWTVQEAITIPAVKCRIKQETNYTNYLDLAEKNGIKKKTLISRVSRGWPPILSALATVKRGKSEFARKAEKSGINYGTYRSRINKLGWAKEQAATIPSLPHGEFLNEERRQQALEGYKKFRKIKK